MYILRSIWGLAALIGSVGVASAADISLGLPLRCEMNQECFIQQYVDVDPGPGAREHTCGPLTYDGHKGTDFRLRDLQMMRDGVEVVASAGGTVLGIRDGMQDIDVRELGGSAALKGRDCGNGVLLDHGDGWQTQYCHLRRGSVSVRKGQTVAKGDVLGLVGMSGAAAFPHVHLSVRRGKQVVDPYRGADAAAEACGASFQDMWDQDVREAVAYRPGGIITIGLYGDTDLDSGKIREGRAHLGEISRNSPALLGWVSIYGIRQGDVVRTRINGPDGAVFFENTDKPHPKNQAQSFKWSGKRNRGRLTAGTYQLLVELIRDGKVIDAWQTSSIVR
ncbi:M23 family metallopeptidase [Minwuia sp.]|uniref:M23 family metallopeptidase n=1 Tax=Minwuia sp. TaxID=2493630 RepID=UPI003A905F42